jgi:hypothetical protein
VGPYDSKSSQDVTSDTLDKAKSPKPPSIDQEATGSALTPDTHLGSTPGELAPAEQKLLLKGNHAFCTVENSALSSKSS